MLAKLLNNDPELVKSNDCYVNNSQLEASEGNILILYKNRIFSVKYL